QTGEVSHDLARFLAIGVRHRLFCPAEIQESGYAFLFDGCGRLVLYNRDAAGEGRSIEFEAVRGPVTLRLGGIDPAANHLIAFGHADVDLGRIAVRRVAADWEPARRIHQVGEVVLNSRELDPIYGRIFLAGKAAVIVERDRDRLALLERLV